ncbi:peptidoglycan/LPS O-acetylase OafA/YrhL [Caulobacter ginsengisoli]|uniref:Peptidoglycan/LPS O-acetylase OafA/YrhL n=1 Tax=Caulobacter ginsengisoli TaxID=400775 RepID=A0ABU0IUA4_9CAUL|nr:acyltransferase [Caulobacter ginsengisoli]MDQ0465591.1 peptidoglycan/LPS O-acetylase OafA/YrhL [Caulobacter ginsengisoli]
MGTVRVVLALAVLLSHLPLASYKILSGGLAVQSFFIISGFYMALVLEGKYRDARLFYSNRLLRLAPTYFIMLVVGAIALFGLKASVTSSPELMASLARNPLSAAVLAVENLVVVGQDLLFWFKIDPHGALVFDAYADPAKDNIAWQGLMAPQSWSLSTELMFYAVAPFIVRWKWGWIALLAAASIALRLAGHWLDVDYLLWQGRLFPTALFMFLLGVLGFKAMPLVEKAPRAIGWGAAAVLLAYCLAFTALTMPPLMARWVTYGVVALTVPWIFHAFKDNRFDRWIGDLSYPVYLSQLIVIGLVLTFKPPLPIWAAIGGTFAFSALLLVLVEHPVDRWRQRRLAARQA